MNQPDEARTMDGAAVAGRVLESTSVRAAEGSADGPVSPRSWSATTHLRSPTSG
jgi:hypothetical protein